MHFARIRAPRNGHVSAYDGLPVSIEDLAGDWWYILSLKWHWHMKADHDRHQEALNSHWSFSLTIFLIQEAETLKRFR